MELFKFIALVIAGALWSAVLAVFFHQKDVHPIRELLDGFSRLGWTCKVGVLVLVVQLTMFGGAKHGTNDVTNVDGTNVVTEVSGTNDVGEVENGEAESSPLQGMGLRGPFLSGRPSQSLTSGEDTPRIAPPSELASLGGYASPLSFIDILPELSITDITRGYRLESVATNDDISYAMPSNGVVRGTWHLTGAYEDVQKVRLGDFLFPLGTNLCSSLWTYPWGKVRPQLKNTVNEIAAVGAPMSAIPDTSRFWTAATSNDTYMLTWENFAVGRQSLTTNNQQLTTLSAQIELHRNGDFITRSNNVESVYRRVIEPNPDPLHPYGPVQDLSVINETNAYCWVDIVVNNADAWVAFEGDGPSNLADPSFAAKAGETNHVVILIGKTYKVTCDMEFSVVGKSDPAIDERWEDDRTVWLNWPVRISVLEDGDGPRLLSAGLRLMGAGPTTNGFTMCVEPEGLGGAFTWTNSCCSVGGSGMHFSYSCGGFCLCGGCGASGFYSYEGYCMGCSGGWCGCSWFDDDDQRGEDDPDDPDPAPGLTVRFSKRAVIFEEAYENAPGNTVPRQSTTTTLTLEAHGGMKGGTATFTFANREKLEGPDIPASLDVPAGHCKTYRFTYRGNLPSGEEDDVIVRGEFTENNAESGSDPLEAETTLTCVQVELEAIYEAPENPCANRHVYGVGEKVKFKVTPQEEAIKLKTEKLDTGDEAYRYELFEGQAEVDASSPREYVCPISASYTPPIRVTLGGVEYRPSLSLVEPERVITPETGFEGCHPSGDVGQSTLVTTSYIGPMTVSFQGIRVAEIPCKDVIPPSGYFATTNFTGFLSHTFYDDNGKPGAGAGYAYPIKTGNYWTVDKAGGGLYPNWSPGRLEWKIPIGWGRLQTDLDRTGTMDEVEYERKKDSSSRPLLIGGRTDKYKQVFTIEEDGTSKVEKFGHWLSRGRYCKIILDGVQKKWNHWF